MTAHDEEMANTNALSTGINATEMAQIAARDGLLVDEEGERYYFAIDPGYAYPRAVHHRVLTMRAILCILSSTATLLALVGQLVYFRQGLYAYNRYGIWRNAALSGCETGDYVGTDISVRKGLAVVTTVLGFIAAVLGVVYTATFAADERARDAVRSTNVKLQSAYGDMRVDDDADDHHLRDDDHNHAAASSTSFSVSPYANDQVENHGQVKSVPLQEAEQRRRTRDWAIGITIFVLLVLSAIFSLVTLCLMTSYSYFLFTCDNGISRYDAALPLYITSACVFTVCAVLMAIPQLTLLRMCTVPVVQPALLMQVDVNCALSREREARRVRQRRFHHVGIPVAQYTTAAVVAAYPLASEYYAHDAAAGAGEAEVQMVHSYGGGKRTGMAMHPPEVSGGYTTATYYTAAPPLFSIEDSGATK